MNRSEQINELAAALSTAQGEFPTIPRDKKVKVTMASGGTYTFAYAPLDTILEKIRPVLAKNGLSIIQNCTNTGTATLLMHKSGQWIETDPLKIEPIDRKPQSLGSAETYEQRYQLRACLLLPVDDDDDANIAQGNKVEEQKKTPPQAKEPEKPAESKPPSEPPKPKDSSGLDQKQKQMSISTMLLEIYINENDAQDALLKLTTWEKGGVVHEGKRNPFELKTEKTAKGHSQTDVYFRDVKKLYDGWKAAQEKEEQNADHEQV